MKQRKTTRRRALRVGFSAIGLSLSGCLSQGAKNTQSDPGKTDIAWSKGLNSSVESLLVTDDDLYVATNWRVLSVDQASGESNWEFEVDEPSDSICYRGRLAVDGDSLYVGSCEKTYAIDSNGTEKWTSEVATLSTPAVGSEHVYLGFEDLNAILKSDGTTAWTTQIENGALTSPVVEDGTVFVGTDEGALRAYDAETGRQRWEFKSDGAYVSIPAVKDGTLFAVAARPSDDTGQLLAFDPSSGDKRWTAETGQVTAGTAPVVHDGSIYIGCANSRLYAHELNDGDQRWVFEVGDWLVTEPAVTKEAIYVGSNDNHLYEIEPSSGTETWKFDTGASVTATPVVVENIVYAGTVNSVYAFERKPSSN